MRKLKLLTAKDRYDKGIKVVEVTWGQLAARLQKFKVTDETFAEYMAMESLDQLAVKDVGWFVGGPFEPAKRRKANLIGRDVLALDVDHIPGEDAVQEVLRRYRARGLEFVWHTSHKHSEQAPRLRLVFPLTRRITPEEYEPLARAMAEVAGMDMFDDTGYQASRVMFWPSRAQDGEHGAGRHKGEWLDPDFVFDLRFEDPLDWEEWPRSAREQDKGYRSPTTRAEDPFAKPGIIGAFNRAFPIPEAIVRFELPYEESGMGEGRYTYTGGTSADGAIYYEEDGHLYSWHESDPARGNHNAWDLVRLHLFGDRDSDDTVPIGRRPSQQAMREMCVDLEELEGETDYVEDFNYVEDFQDESGGAPETSEGEEGAEAPQPRVANEKKAPKAPRSVLTFATIRDQIAARGSPFDAEHARKIIVKIAAARLEASQESVLAAHLKDAWQDPKPTKQAILDEIKGARRKLTQKEATDGEIEDIQILLIQRWLDQFFEGGEHIRRIGKSWWVYDAGVWRVKDDEALEGTIVRTIVHLRTKRPEKYQELVATVGEKDTSTIVNSLAPLARRVVAEKHDKRDPLGLMKSRDAIINCLNGEIHFTPDGDVEFTPHHPELFLTSQVEVNYDPTAECPEWDRFCAKVFRDAIEPEEMQRHLEELGGYLIQPTRWLKSWVLFKGETNAGKTTIGKAFENLLGHASVNRALGAYDGSNNHAEAGLVGKLMLIDEDFTKGVRLPDGFIKKISEEKTITANPKTKDEFSFRSRALPVIISNHWPPSRDVSDAIRERALVFDFPHRIPESEQSDELAQRMLEDELPGLLNRLVGAFARLRHRGKWSLPTDCVLAREAWVENADSARQFLAGCVVRVPDGNGWLERPALYGLYTHWFRENNPSGRALGRNEFLERAERVLGPVAVRRGVRGWHGWEYLSSEF